MRFKPVASCKRFEKVDFPAPHEPITKTLFITKLLRRYSGFCSWSFSSSSFSRVVEIPAVISSSTVFRQFKVSRMVSLSGRIFNPFFKALSIFAVTKTVPVYYYAITVHIHISWNRFYGCFGAKTSSFLSQVYVIYITFCNNKSKNIYAS